MILELNGVIVGLVDRRVFADYELKELKGAIDRLAAGIGAVHVMPAADAPPF